MWKDRVPVSVLLFGALVIGCSASRPGPATSPVEVTPETPVATGAPPSAPTPARIDDVVETLHGVEVHDPYRWMERGGAELDGFLDDQDRHARATLAAIPGRDALRDAIHDANRGVTRVSFLGIAGEGEQVRIFLSKQTPDEDTAQIWVRDGWTGADRLLVDPRTRDHDGVHHTVDYSAPSPDGKHLAYGISASGSEDSVIEILDVERGEIRPETIDRAQYASIDWRDDTSFFYWRRAAPQEGDTGVDWFKNSATYLHVLGDDPAKAQPLIGPVRADLGLAPEAFTWIQASPASPWLLAGATPGTSADLEYFVVAKRKLVPGQKIPWRRLSGPKDHVTFMDAHGDQIYALTYDGAPRYRVKVLDARKGTLAKARDFVAERDLVIEGFSAAKDAMYLQLLDGGRSRVQRVSWKGKPLGDVPLPVEGTAYPDAYADRVGCFLRASSWTRPWETFAYEPSTGVRPLGLEEPWPIDYAQVIAEEVEVESADGTRVPLSIVRRADGKLDGAAPALLDGYAAYGIVSRPSFRPITLTWVDRGGVYASCHGRGSGDRGKPWHLDGIKAKKENGVDDFIACAEYLVAKGYTSSAHLTVTGTSAGGILVGGAVTRRPELFAAALLRVPVVNLLRFERTEGGPANVPEHGTVADPADFAALLASDPYHRVVDGTAYPAIVLTGGRHDVRVPAWQPAKMAARLQAATASGKPVLLRVESDAGHGLGSTRSQTEEEYADVYAFALTHSGVAVDR